jgi:hypothetical protein
MELYSKATDKIIQIIGQIRNMQMVSILFMRQSFSGLREYGVKANILDITLGGLKAE